MAELISKKFIEWEKTCNDRFNKLKENEEKLNSFFIDLYGISNEITPEVDERCITVRKADLQREIKSLISYAVGCIFGRYSLDKEGLCYAGGKWEASDYSTIIPCSDNIMTINNIDDGLNAALTDFIEKAYGKDTLEENLRFISDSLGGNDDSRNVIFKYLRKGFFADHLKVYKKRPVYWQIESGSKGAFKALMYIHRYGNDTLSILENDYAIPRFESLKAELSKLNEAYNAASGSERTLIRRNISRLQALILEMEGFIYRVHDLASQGIALELDDGVKCNYEKLKDILAQY